MTYEQRQYATGGILLIMVAVAAFILGIAYQNNKLQIKNRIAPLLGQMQMMTPPPITDDGETMMADRRKAQLRQGSFCKMQRLHSNLEQRVERLERMQMIRMNESFDQGMAVPAYPAAQYQDTVGTQTMPMSMPLPQQVNDMQTIEFGPMEQGQGTIMLRRGN